MAVELMKLRLDKYLADMGIGTRTEVKKAITKGQVRVNEETVKRPEIKIDTEKDHVFYQGQMVHLTAGPGILMQNMNITC